jgi:arylsulfatase A-like enzyme
MRKFTLICFLALLLEAGCTSDKSSSEGNTPNVIIIYTDDVGYGDVSSYGATEYATPNIDRLADNGVLFTNSHATSATCTPSRFGLLVGEYPWRRPGTGIARGDAALIIPTERFTMADMFRNAGYYTGVVGKWHLGLGPDGGPDWNAEIRPGPSEVGFDYSFLIPATGDRVPCVYTENNFVVGLDPKDPIYVRFGEKIGDEPTGRENPELLKMHPSHGHDMTIVNGISRIGFMTGGKAARWVDEDMADVITEKAKEFIRNNKNRPFFLYFSTHDIHVPRVAHDRFVGKSGLGPRGDVMLQLDWCVGELINQIEALGLEENTIIIFASDNGPVLDDGYQDQAVELLGNHNPFGPFRGGKYSVFEAGTRVPMILQWKGTVKKDVSDALFSQIDLFASFAAMLNQEIPEGEAPDSFNNLNTLLGKSKEDRVFVVEQAASGTLGIKKGDWKYIEPSKGPRINKNVNIELGHDPEPQLYNLADDPGERNNLARQYPDKVKELAGELERIKKKLVQ